VTWPTRYRTGSVSDRVAGASLNFGLTLITSGCALIFLIDLPAPNPVAPGSVVECSLVIFASSPTNDIAP
jgi:hypothetical protein